MSIYSDFCATFSVATPEQAQATAAKDVADAAQKTHAVLRWVEANNNCGDARRIVDTFGLAWSLDRDYGNGIAKVGFYIDETLRYRVMSLSLPTAEWFRA